VDTLFLDVCDNNGFTFDRKEIEISSYKALGQEGRVKKADAVFSVNFKGNHELMLLETAKPDDKKHIAEDQSKLARCLRTCLLHSVRESGSPEFLTKIPFFGIQTHGSFLHLLINIRSEYYNISNGPSFRRRMYLCRGV
jgi:hypothetical protein